MKIRKNAWSVMNSHCMGGLSEDQGKCLIYRSAKRGSISRLSTHKPDSACICLWVMFMKWDDMIDMFYNLQECSMNTITTCYVFFMPQSAGATSRTYGLKCHVGSRPLMYMPLIFSQICLYNIWNVMTNVFNWCMHMAWCDRICKYM